MKARTHAFAVTVVGFVQTMVDRCESRRLKDQLVGAAWGVDGNWRAACCARTHKEFTSKLGTVVEEADEAEELLNVIHDSKVSQAPELARLRDESTQLRKIFKRASITASENERRSEERKKPSSLPAFPPSCLTPAPPLLSSPMRVARRYRISGRVQGVGFRYFAEAAAAREGVHGWIRNLPDGGVEALAEGDEESVERFERAIRHGPPAARVEHVDVEGTVPGGRDTGFAVT